MQSPGQAWSWEFAENEKKMNLEDSLVLEKKISAILMVSISNLPLVFVKGARPILTLRGVVGSHGTI